jgi:hypothetical protein
MCNDLLSLLIATMTIRAQALWNHSRPIKMVLLLFLLVTVLTPPIVVGRMYAKATLKPATPPFTGCSITAPTQLIYVIYIPAFIDETLIIMLTVIKSYPIFRQGLTKLPLYNLLFRDGLVYYCAIVVAQVLTLVCFYSGNISIPLSGPSLPAAIVACNRLLIRLQSVLINQDVTTLDPKSSTINGSTGLWSGSIFTTDEFSARVSHFERRGHRQRDELATNWTELVLADLAEHQQQCKIQAACRDTGDSVEGTEQDATG